MRHTKFESFRVFAGTSHGSIVSANTQATTNESMANQHEVLQWAQFVEDAIREKIERAKEPQ